MTDIYDQHRLAFRGVSAYVVVRGDTRVATIAFRHGQTGNVACYLHVAGLPMVRASAGGGGYDKRAASAAAAARKLTMHSAFGDDAAIKAALSEDDGLSWQHYLERAGFTVFQAV